MSGWARVSSVPTYPDISRHFLIGPQLVTPSRVKDEAGYYSRTPFGDKVKNTPNSQTIDSLRPIPDHISEKSLSRRITQYEQYDIKGYSSPQRKKDKVVLGNKKIKMAKKAMNNKKKKELGDSLDSVAKAAASSEDKILETVKAGTSSNQAVGESIAKSNAKQVADGTAAIQAVGKSKIAAQKDIVKSFAAGEQTVPDDIPATTTEVSEITAGEEESTTTVGPKSTWKKTVLGTAAGIVAIVGVAICAVYFEAKTGYARNYFAPAAPPTMEAVKAKGQSTVEWIKSKGQSTMEWIESNGNLSSITSPDDREL